jgi:pimeloyl-ACP methyl ester carboxylesterase
MRHYNRTPEEYLRILHDEQTGAEADLCIIEFDDEGEFWDNRQLVDTLTLIHRRNAESSHGIVVPVFIHGWKNNADWSREDGDLRQIAAEVMASAIRSAAPQNPMPRRVVAVFIGWRGDVLKGAWLKEPTFWNRLLASDRVASSINLKESLTKIILTAKQRSDSKVIMYGHSMGGRIVFNAMATSLIDMSINREAENPVLPVDLVIMANPAVRAVDVARFVDMLKRHDVQLVMRTDGNSMTPVEGPLIVSVTSEADGATKRAFPFGQSFVRLFRSYRKNDAPGRPEQAWLAAHTDGHTDMLLSHRASVVDGQVRIEPVPDRYNDTPYWVIRTTAEICAHHSDINNPRMNELILQLLALRNAYTAACRIRLVAGNPLGNALPEQANTSL